MEKEKKSGRPPKSAETKNPLTIQKKKKQICAYNVVKRRRRIFQNKNLVERGPDVYHVYEVSYYPTTDMLTVQLKGREIVGLYILDEIGDNGIHGELFLYTKQDNIFHAVDQFQLKYDEYIQKKHEEEEESKTFCNCCGERHN